MAQSLGHDALDFAFVLEGSDWGNPTVLQEGWENLFLPLRSAWIRDWNGREEPIAGLELMGSGLALSAVLPAGRSDGMVVRCFNLCDRPTEGWLRFSFPVARIQQINADERVLRELPMRENGVMFPVQPRQIVSLLFTK
jgi:alpha-mannosidase